MDTLAAAQQALATFDEESPRATSVLAYAHTAAAVAIAEQLVIANQRLTQIAYALRQSA